MAVELRVGQHAGLLGHLRVKGVAQQRRFVDALRPVCSRGHVGALHIGRGPGQAQAPLAHLRRLGHGLQQSELGEHGGVVHKHAVAVQRDARRHAQQHLPTLTAALKVVQAVADVRIARNGLHGLRDRAADHGGGAHGPVRGHGNELAQLPPHMRLRQGVGGVKNGQIVEQRQQTRLLQAFALAGREWQRQHLRKNLEIHGVHRGQKPLGRHRRGGGIWHQLINYWHVGLWSPARCGPKI